MANKSEFRTDIEALGKVLTALSSLDPTAQQWVLSTAAGRLSVPGITSLPTTTAHSSKQTITTPQGGELKDTAVKEFIRQKSPKSDVDRVACLAFYLTYARETIAFSSKDLTLLNTEAAGPKINMSRAVDNATKQSGYLASASKGKKQITTYGEDVVNALPNYEEVRAIQSPSKQRRKKSKAKKVARR
jgi:hypothetical protein